MRKLSSIVKNTNKELVIADIPSALSKIQIEEVKYRAAVSEATLNKVGGSINAIIENGPEALGTVVQSVLTQAQFQAIRGVGWVLMNGQDITGSDLYTLTGQTTSGSMPSGGALVQAPAEGNLAQQTTGSNKAHSHSVSFTNGLADEGGYNTQTTPSSAVVNVGSITATTSSEGSNGYNLAAGVYINHFIKINL